MFLEQRREIVRMPDIQLDKFQGALSLQPFQIFPDAFTGQIVDNNHVVSTPQKPTGGIAADESGASGNDCFQERTLLPKPSGNSAGQPASRRTVPIILASFFIVRYPHSL